MLLLDSYFSDFSGKKMGHTIKALVEKTYEKTSLMIRDNHLRWDINFISVLFFIFLNGLLKKFFA